MAKAILYDSTLCIGCRSCETACAERWNLPYNDVIAAQEKLAANKLSTIQTRGDKYVRRACMHCQDPACASVCPVGAFQKTSLGPVVYDANKCIGCRYCMLACPFQVPAYEWSSRTPRVRKCDMCYERQAAGKPTACVEACPNGAAVGGERDALIGEARKRIAEKPGEYVNKIYGIQEAGGTSVLILSSVPFEKLGLRTQLPTEPLPQLTWRVLSTVPDIATAGSVLLGGVWWITHRRDEVARVEGRRTGKGNRK
jgi:formate dehydrogenase iron-sulfur subunit